METISPRRVAELRSIVGEVPLETVSHLELKRLAQDARATVRTADTMPYANVILVSG